MEEGEAKGMELIGSFSLGVNNQKNVEWQDVTVRQYS